MNDAKTDFLVAHMQAVGSFYDNYLINGDGFYSKNIFKRFLQKLGLMKKEKLSAGEYLSLIDGNVLQYELFGNSLERVECGVWENNIWVDTQVPLKKQVTLKSGIYALTSKGVCGPDDLSEQIGPLELTGNDLLKKAFKKS